MWTLYTRRAGEIFIAPDPFVFSASLEQHTFFSSVNRTCVLWCVENTNVCLGANVLDSDTWAASAVTGQWRLMDGGRLTLLTSESREVQAQANRAYQGPKGTQSYQGPQGPAWFRDLCLSLKLSALDPLGGNQPSFFHSHSFQDFEELEKLNIIS